MTTKKAALYCRVSTVYQIDKDSLPVQRDSLVAYCEQVFSIRDHEVFVDAGYSGKNTDRPAYQQMMARIRSGEFSHLMVYKIDRISRNLLDFAEMYDELKQLDCIFISRNEQFDTSTAIGEAMLKIILIFAELERKMTSERVTGVMIGRAQKGLWNGAQMPFGYQWSEKLKYPVIEPNEAAVVKFMYDSYLSGMSSVRLSYYFNDTGVKTKRGGRWTPVTITNILSSPMYKGTLRYNYRSSARGKIKPESEWVLIDNNHPAIVSAETWQRVQDLLHNNNSHKRDPGHKNFKKYFHAFGKLVYCECGYMCTSKIDRARSSGFRPTMYICCNYQQHWGCTNNTHHSDVTIGPFVFQYIHNMLHIKDTPDLYPDPAAMMKALLAGMPFNVSGVVEIDDIFNHLHAILRPVPYGQASDPVLSSPASDGEAELKKIDRAIERLKDAYLYADDNESISKKEFVSDLDNLQEKRRSIKQKLDSSRQADHTDIFKNMSEYVITRSLAQSTLVDYQAIAIHTDPEVLHDFIHAILLRIDINGKRIQSITFTNGMQHTFVYS